MPLFEQSAASAGFFSEYAPGGLLHSLGLVPWPDLDIKR